MNQSPRHPKRDRMVDWWVLFYSFFYIGIIQSIVCWSCFYSMPAMRELTMAKKATEHFTASERLQNREGMTLYYWALVLGQVGAAIATSTSQQSVFTYGLPNLWLNICIIAELAVALACTSWTPLQRNLHFA